MMQITAIALAIVSLVLPIFMLKPGPGKRIYGELGPVKVDLGALENRTEATE